MRSKLLLSLVFFCSISVFSFAQKIGAWDVHFSYTGTVSQIVEAEDKLYVLAEGKLYSYFPEEDYYETYVKKDRGNSDILKIEYNLKNEALVVFRENYDIDILYSNGNFTTISDFKNATQNIDKTLNDIYCIDDFAYLSTNFGILVVNIAREEIKETGLFNKKFYSTCVFGDYLYAATEEGVLRILLSDNMLDLNDWEAFGVSSKYDNPNKFADEDIRKILQFNDKLSFLAPTKGLYSWDEENDKMLLINDSYLLRLDYISNERIVSTRYGGCIDIRTDETTHFNLESMEFAIPNKETLDEYWVGSSDHYLSLVKKMNNDSCEILQDFKVPNGPSNNIPFDMVHEYGKLFVTGGGYAGDRYNNPGYLSQYRNGEWVLFDNKEVEDKLGIKPRDYISVITDPFNTNRLFVSSWGDGLYEFIDGKPNMLYTSENTDGVLQEIFNGKDFIRIGRMKFDKSGNLWLTNTMVTTPIKVLTKDGKWIGIYHDEIATKSNNDETLKVTPVIGGVTIDRYNKKWLYSKQSNRFIFVLDDKGNPSSVLNHGKRLINNFVDQDNKNINIESINDIQEDLSGNMWIATNAGPFVMYGISNILTTKNVVFNKIKVPRNDGTNNVDILLEGTDIKAIAIDGANRKWLGTPYGAYLISATGLETIHYFNMENSPLPSNEVISLAIDPDNGTVYIGTDKGIVSYVGDATKGRSDFSDVYAFPNPVRPEYDGIITITGLQANSNVKITDVRGNILNQGPSLGGRYVWDGRNASGRRVDTGVYLVFGATEDGKSGVVTKILVVN